MLTCVGCSVEIISYLAFALSFYLTHKRTASVEEDISDDNRSSSLGRSAPSDDTSDYQDEVSECKFTTVLLTLDLAP